MEDVDGYYKQIVEALYEKYGKIDLVPTLF
jgi:hypothetical protein